MPKLIETDFDGLYVIEPEIFGDDRGYFFESYNKEKLKELGINTNFIQDNESRSVYGVIRGLHYQMEPYAQTKLLRVVFGKIIDVALDLRKNSASFGKFYTIELSDSNKKQFYIPKGFAHGFSVISDYAIVNYKCDNLYAKDFERGIYPLDAKLNIDWKIDPVKAIISQKDKSSKPFIDAIDFF